MTDEHPARRVTLQRHILESQQLDGSLNSDINGVVGTIFGSWLEVARFDEFMRSGA